MDNNLEKKAVEKVTNYGGRIILDDEELVLEDKNLDIKVQIDVITLSDTNTIMAWAGNPMFDNDAEEITLDDKWKEQVYNHIIEEC